MTDLVVVTESSFYIPLNINILFQLQIVEKTPYLPTLSMTHGGYLFLDLRVHPGPSVSVSQFLSSTAHRVFEMFVRTLKDPKIVCAQFLGDSFRTHVSEFKFPTH